MKRLIALTCAIVLVDTVFHAALVPLIPYFSEEFGLSKLGAGILSGAFGAGVLAGSLPAGYLVFKVGVKTSAVSGFAIFSVTSLVFGFAGSGWLLILARLAEGFGSALSWVAAFTWLISFAPAERRGTAIGTLMSSAVVGALLGPVVGSAASLAGIAATFVVVAVIGAGIAFWVALTPSPPPDPNRPFFPMVRRLLDRNLLLGVSLVTLSPLLFGAVLILAPLALSDAGWSAAAIGLVFLVAAAFESVIQPLIGRWTDRAGFRTPVLLCLGAAALLLVALPLSESLGGVAMLPVLVVLAAVFFNGPVTPGTALFSRGAQGVGVDQAIVFGGVNFAWAAGSALGPPVAGAVSDSGGPVFGDALAYLLLAVVCVAALITFSRRKLA